LKLIERQDAVHLSHFCLTCGCVSHLRTIDGRNQEEDISNKHKLPRGEVFV